MSVTGPTEEDNSNIENIRSTEGIHNVTSEETLQILRVDPATGLSRRETVGRRRLSGRNVLRRAETRSILSIFLAQLRGIIVFILAASIALSLLLGEFADAIAISIVLVINTAIGFFSEYKAIRSMDSLRRLGVAKVHVLRSGQVRNLDAAELVPGDIVLLKSGDIVVADLRLLEVTDLQSDESTLTGESVPVLKQTDCVALDAPIAERSNMVFRGSAITRGNAKAVVTTTGMATEIGRIATMADAAAPELTPLEKRLDRLGHQLVFITLASTLLIAFAGYATGTPLQEIIRISVALAIAAVPEGLPVVATIALARGMWRMANQSALVKRLAAVETLGAITVILTDKTGTLTENRMTVRVIALPEGDIELTDKFTRQGNIIDVNEDKELERALTVASLCNETVPESPNGSSADPLEHALIEASQGAGFTRSSLLQQQPLISQMSFSSDTKMMSTIHSSTGGMAQHNQMYVKGAPESVMQQCAYIMHGTQHVRLDNKLRDQWMQRNVAMAEDGLRVIALACKQMENSEASDLMDLTLVALVGLIDPARQDVKRAILACQEAGLRVVMVTGDQAGTARKIGKDVGIASDGVRTFEVGKLASLRDLDEFQKNAFLEADILARVSPAVKLDLVRLYQSAGEIVAMTGDGVNDAPALKQADIGVAMGLRGTEVARDAAAMVLRDDSFNTIVVAIRQGRVIFSNIRSFVTYLLSCNFSEILLIGVAVLAGLPLPLLPIHILFLNFVTDVFPAFALGLGEGSNDVMRQPPRNPEEPVINCGHWMGIAAFGIMLAMSVLTAYVIV